MHVQQVVRAGALVQIVDVLGDQQNLARPFPLQPGQGQVGRIGLHRVTQQAAPPVIVEVVNPDRIPLKGFRRGDIFQAYLRPDAVGIAKGIEAGFLGNPRAGQNHDLFA